MRRHYCYVGSPEIAHLPADPRYRYRVEAAADVERWAWETQQVRSSAQAITATFIINGEEQLWIADRHSEHIACADGQPVLAAGEITFHWDCSGISVTEVTNQSTGYCPEPDSWDVVAAVLQRLNLAHPTAFTTCFLFRRCIHCGTTNIVKDSWWECAACQAPLSPIWNYD